MSPTTAPAFLTDEEQAASNRGKDPRTPGQQRHDIFIGILDAMARSRDVPTIGGAAPTVLVSVRAEDLESGHGAGWSDRVDGPISMTTVRQMICTGGTQTVVLNKEGRIISLGSPERCFTARQRRAMTLRDGGCLIPGCQIPAGWCEVHHVIPDRDGGPTHTDNGVLGEFNRSSQHLDHGGVRWVAGSRICRRRRRLRGGSGLRIGPCVRRCVHRGGRSRLVRCSERSGH